MRQRTPPSELILFWSHVTSVFQVLSLSRSVGGVGENPGNEVEHNGSPFLSLEEVGERTGVRPVRYDFSEPQASKDICDRKAASMKAHIKRWVNDNHDVITAEDMKAALE